MGMLPDSSVCLIKQLFFEFSGKKIKHAIGGALALNCWVPSRSTQDIDIYFFITLNELSSTLKLLQKKLNMRLLINSPLEQAKNGWAIPGEIKGVKIDMLLPFSFICLDAGN